MRDDLPTGTVTLLLTDIEGSTRLLHGVGDGYAEVLAAHREILRQAFEVNEGSEVDTQGDAFFVAFPGAPQALAAAVAAQRGLAAHRWPEGGTVRVRMGLHTGEPTRTDEGYVGMDVHAAARICAAGNGGQVLLSERTAREVGEGLPEGVTLRDVGEHRLKDLEGPQRLFQVVIAGLPSDFAPLRSLTTRPNNLPTPPTPFVGREREVASVRDLLQRDGVRVATLTGPGGTGKTRLALRVASELLHAFEDGAFFVPLASVSDPALVLPAIARALGVREGRGLPLIENLKRQLRDRELLLVLDNFEQVRRAAREVAELLASCPRTKLLVTSRELLRLSGEHHVPVPPLSTPAYGALPALSELERYDSVRLFCERAAAVQPDFRLEEATAAPVAQICRRLDGLPLAIELAAARAQELPPAVLLEKLESRLTVLTDGPIDLPERQQTLRDTIAWSFDLLEPEEQRLYRRLAVFVGGWEAAAAQQVCAAAELEIPFSNGIRSLVDKSLVRPESFDDAGPQKVIGPSDAAVRLTMLETIREFGLEQLAASGEEQAVRERHRAWFVRFAERAEPELRGPEHGTWLDRLEREYGNLSGALENAEGAGAADAGLRICSALWLFWYERGRIGEGRDWLEQYLAASDTAPTELRARALGGAAELARHLGQYERAEELCAESLEIHRELGDRSGTAQALRALGVIVQFRGQSERACPLLEESLALSRELGDTQRIAHALRDLGSDAMIRGDHARARGLYEEGLVYSRELGDESTIATLLLNLGEIAKLGGELERARTLYGQSLASFRDLEFQAAIAYCLEALAAVEAALGRGELAARLFGAAEKLREVIDVPVEPHNLEQYQADVLEARRGVDDDAFDEAWDAGRELPLPHAIAEALGEQRAA